MAKLWLVERTDEPYYDVVVEFVCVAETEDDALGVEPGSESQEIPPSGATFGMLWAPREMRKATYLGEARPDLLNVLRQRESIAREPIVCAYFRHG